MRVSPHDKVDVLDPPGDRLVLLVPRVANGDQDVNAGGLRMGNSMSISKIQGQNVDKNVHKNQLTILYP